MYFLRSIFVFACCVGVTYAARAATTDVNTFPEGYGPNGPIGDLNYCFFNTDNSRDDVKCDVNDLVKSVGCKGDKENICAYNVKKESDIDADDTQTYYIQSCTSTCNTDAGYSGLPRTQTVWPNGWDCGFFVTYCICDETACAKVKGEVTVVTGGKKYTKHACVDNVCTSTDETFIECNKGYYLDLDSVDKCTKCSAENIKLYTKQGENNYNKRMPTTKGVGATSKKECYIPAGTYYYKLDNAGDDNAADIYHEIEIPDVYYTGS